MMWSKHPWPKALSGIKDFGLALLSVAVALGGALLLQRWQLRDAEVPLFLFAVAVASWYGGVRAALMALVLSCASFDYFFVEPLYTLDISRTDLPYFLVFIAFTFLVSWFSAVRRRVEKDLLRARDKLEMEMAQRTRQAGLLNLTHDSIFVRDMQDIITYWNRGAQELYGWTSGEAIGKNAHELLQTAFPAPIEEIRARLMSAGRWEGELRKIKADGTQVTVASRWSLRRDERGRPAAILQTENDVTEHQKREQEILSLNEELRKRTDRLETEVAERTRHANLLDLTHDSIFVRDMSDIITYWNLGSQELFGWKPDEAIGKYAHELLCSVFPVPIEEIHAELLRSGRWEGELGKTRADGTRLVVSARWSLQRDKQGRAAAILATNDDITERKQWEQEILSLNQELGRRSAQLEASNKELEAFAYSVSHDLRAPLRHMAGFTELLQKQSAGVLNERSQRYVNIVLESAKRMGNLIDDLLTFSRLGRADTHKTMVSLDQLVKEVLTEVRQDAKGRNIVWKFDRLPACYGDRSMLRLVLINLISNAVKFTRTRERAEIEVGCMEQEKDKVVVFVRDNGIGFDMKYVNKLFGVFQRLHPPEAFEGTGIGLATVGRIVHRHGGEVWAEGFLDKGATFYFSLCKSP
jgi:PAS domain S-box-containing protein